MDRTMDHAAPLGAVSSGRLKFVGGASNVAMRADLPMEDLYRARFEGPAPRVRTEGGTATIEYPRTLNPLDWRRYAAEVALNGSVPWEIGFRGGLSKLDADLRGLELGSFGVSGGASRVELTLPRPRGVVPVRVFGGASDLAVHRPAGVAVRVRVGHGASGLRLDGRRLGAVGGETLLQTPDYEGAADRYEVEVSGGASNLTVDAR